jgi:hypothetical protein
LKAIACRADGGEIGFGGRRGWGCCGRDEAEQSGGKGSDQYCYNRLAGINIWIR